MTFVRKLPIAGTAPTTASFAEPSNETGFDTAPLVGHLAAWNYFQSVDTPENAEFIAKWKAFTKNDKRVTNDPMEAHVIGFNMWVKAVEKAGTTDVDKVTDAMIGIEVPNMTGGMAKMLPNHHLTKPVLIGEIQADGQFETVWQTDGLVPGDAWSDFLPGSKDIEADWVTLHCPSTPENRGMVDDLFERIAEFDPTYLLFRENSALAARSA